MVLVEKRSGDKGWRNSTFIIDEGDGIRTRNYSSM